MEGVVQPRTKGKFLTSLNASRKENLELSFSQAAKLAKEKKGAVLFERLEEGQLYTPFTDCDHYTDSAERPSDEYIDEVQEKMLANLGKLVNDQFEDKHMGSFGMAIRHGYHEEKKVFKLSWRCYFLGFVITLSEMKKAIVSKGLHKAGVGSLDASPYNKNQLLGCVGFQKTKTDKRILEPIMNYELPLENFMVQNISGNETILRYDCEEQSDETCTEHIEDTGFESIRFAPPWDIVELLVMNLNAQKRCGLGSYALWTRVGWAIAGVARAAKRSGDGLELWLQFCRQCMDMYIKDPMKARVVYLGAKREDQQLGWKSLMDALKEDNFEVFNTIKEQLSKLCAESKPVENLAEQKVLKKFIKNHFHHQPKHVKDLVVTTYDSGKFIIASTDETTCPIIEEDHEEIFNPYIVIGLKAARDKCRHENCREKTNIVIDAAQYPEDVKLIVQKLLTVQLTPEAAIQNFVIEHKAINFSKIENLELGAVKSSPFGNRYMLTKNRFCQICNCHHPNPENCIIVDQTAKLLAMDCRLNPYNFHPPGGISIPQNVTNVIIQNAYFPSQSEEAGELILSSDFLGDDLPFFIDNAGQRDKFIKSFTGEHNDIAWFVHALWGEEFRYFDQTWHCFETHIWTPIKDVPLLRSRLSTTLCEHYARVQQFYRSHMHTDKAKSKLEQLKKTISNLKVAHFKDSVMKEVVEVFQIENRHFAREINLSNLLPFTNGVLNLDTFDFRAGHPDDKMTLSTKIEYVPYNLEHQCFKKIEAFIDSIMPEPSVRTYLIHLSAVCLTRDTSHQAFYVLTGFGSNGKSIYLDLLSRTLGDFAATTRVGVLTETANSANGAQEAISKLEFKRLVTFNEPSKQSTIQAEVVKQFAGGTDRISTRGLHKSEREFIPEFKPILACNSIPKISEDSHAIWRRVKIIDFPMKFCDNPDVNDPFQKLADNTLAAETRSWSPYMAGFLVEHLRRLRGQGPVVLAPPQAVVDRTSEYRDENDQYKEFLDEYIEPEEDPDKPLQWADLREVFRRWYNPRNPVKLSQRADDVKKYFNTKLGGWYNTTRKGIAVRGYLKFRLVDDRVRLL